MSVTRPPNCTEFDVTAKYASARTVSHGIGGDISRESRRIPSISGGGTYFGKKPPAESANAAPPFQRMSIPKSPLTVMFAILDFTKLAPMNT